MSVERIRLGWLGLIATGFLLFGCSQNNPPEADQVKTSKEHTMQLSDNEMVSPDIPPIDAAAPEEFETASFGLG